MADGDIPLHPCKQPFKGREIQLHDLPESAISGFLWLVTRLDDVTKRFKQLLIHKNCLYLTWQRGDFCATDGKLPNIRSVKSCDKALSRKFNFQENSFYPTILIAHRFYYYPYMNCDFINAT